MESEAKEGRLVMELDAGQFLSHTWEWADALWREGGIILIYVELFFLRRPFERNLFF